MSVHASRAACAGVDAFGLSLPSEPVPCEPRLSALCEAWAVFSEGAVRRGRPRTRGFVGRPDDQRPWAVSHDGQVVHGSSLPTRHVLQRLWFCRTAPCRGEEASDGRGSAGDYARRTPLYWRRLLGLLSRRAWHGDRREREARAWLDGGVDLAAISRLWRGRSGNTEPRIEQPVGLVRLECARGHDFAPIGLNAAAQHRFVADTLDLRSGQTDGRLLRDEGIATAALVAAAFAPKVRAVELEHDRTAQGDALSGQVSLAARQFGERHDLGIGVARRRGRGPGAALVRDARRAAETRSAGEREPDGGGRRDESHDHDTNSLTRGSSR